ncbi:hypothetical protein [uncultured Campylobacter sp.]|uniref:hypothetical protein n=1 Tax=uncultured Campylobacter sp. TaxID=218934 RepID=UPI00261A6A7C|nr:hypothetical protein [uncultured Campylobacter sp.]
MKNEATLKFKNFTARPRYFRVRLRLARAGAALCYARPAEAACLERSSAVAKPSEVGKNFKILNFKSRNATGAYCCAGRNIRLGAGHDINSGSNYAVNFKISNANLKADLARPKASFR